MVFCLYRMARVCSARSVCLVLHDKFGRWRRWSYTKTLSRSTAFLAKKHGFGLLLMALILYKFNTLSIYIHTSDRQWDRQWDGQPARQTGRQSLHHSFIWQETWKECELCSLGCTCLFQNSRNLTPDIQFSAWLRWQMPVSCRLYIRIITESKLSQVNSSPI